MGCLVAVATSAPALAGFAAQPWGGGKPFGSAVALSQTNASGTAIWTESWGAVSYNGCTTGTGGWVVTPAIDQTGLWWNGQASLLGGYHGNTCAVLYAVNNNGTYSGASAGGCSTGYVGSPTEFNLGSVYIPPDGSLSIAVNLRGAGTGCSSPRGVVSRIEYWR